MNSPQKYLLVIADLGHSSPRIPSLCKFLPQFGWQPIIITPKMDTSQRKRFLIESDDTLSIVETKSFRMQYKRQNLSLYSRILRFASRFLGKLFLGWRYQYPDAHKKWGKHVLKEAHIIAENTPVSLILSSSSPVSCHIIAQKLSHSLKVPWIADLRDLWTQNHCYQFNDNRKRIERILEVNTLSYASALTTVTPQWRDKLKQVYKLKCYVIENGCYHSTLRPQSRNQHTFFITYTGLIYPEFQNINLVIDAIQSLLDESNSIFTPIKLTFYGQSSNQIEYIYTKAKKPIPGFISLNGYVPRDESYIAQQRANILLLLNWEDPIEKGVATTKLYEYLASKRPILASGGFGGDYVEDILTKTKAGCYCKTKDEIKLQINTWLQEWEMTKTINMKRNEEFISNFSYENIAGRLTKIFEEVAQD